MEQVAVAIEDQGKRRPAASPRPVEARRHADADNEGKRHGPAQAPERLGSDRPEPPDGELPRWELVHNQLVALARAQAQGDYEQGRWLLAGLRERVHEQLGFGSFLEYAGRLFGYGPRDIAERLRVAKALEQLPGLSEALATSQLTWSAVRELSRVATAETERSWLAAAESRTVREIEKQVAGRRPGDGPNDPPDQGARRHRLSFQISAEAMALWREVKGELTRRHGCSLGDDELFEALARAVLGGPADEGRASYQIALTLCERCQQGWQEGRGEQLAVEPEVVEKAACDGQWIGRVDGAAPGAGAAEAAGPTHVGGGGGCQHGEAAAGSRPRAHQSVPPAVRRQVLRRYGGQCAAPGCQSSDWLDLHHLRYRADGPTPAEELTVLCGCHHTAVHAGRLIIEGDEASGLRFLHADGSPYGSTLSVPRPPTVSGPPAAGRLVDPPSIADAGAVMKTANEALCQMGFRRSDVAQVLRQLRAALAESANGELKLTTHVGTGRPDGPVQTVIRRALAMLTN